MGTRQALGQVLADDFPRDAVAARIPVSIAAVINMSLGLGATLTAFMSAYRTELQDLLGVPEQYYPVALIPIGYPVGHFGPTRRKPVEDVAHLNGWGTPLERPQA